MKPGRAYYAGGARIVVEGVPIKLARKPSDANLAWSRAYERYLNSDASSFLFNPIERRTRRAQEARRTIIRYAEALDITENRAKALIAQHRRHLIANPLVDLSLEYDL